jgi:hypothetical protein
MRRVARSIRLTLAGVALAVGLAACGGGDDASGDPGSANYDPAQTTLHDAGLAVCSEEERLVSAQIPQLPGVIGSRGFFVAADCKGKEVTPNAVIVVQFSENSTTTAGAPKVKAAYPKGETLVYGPLVIVATGPNKTANLAAINTQLQKRNSPTTSTA